VPYTTCTGVCEGIEDYFKIELAIDIIHVMNIIIRFMTSREKDVPNCNGFKTIAIAELKNPNNYLDIITTLPTLVTGY
jgi:hypothetical protein